MSVPGTYGACASACERRIRKEIPQKCVYLWVGAPTLDRLRELARDPSLELLGETLAVGDAENSVPPT